MSHARRGHAIIFNQRKFTDIRLDERVGTNIDRDNLQQELTRLQFTVTVYDDMKWSQIRSIVEKLANSDHSDCDCILIAVLSHGNQEYVWANDYEYKLERLYSLFTADRCPSLANKPKIFIVQARQGPLCDAGVELSGNTQTDSVATTSGYTIPTHSDFLIFSSSMPGHVSFRNETHGSWFIRSLCEQLKANGTRYDILRLITFVNRRVAIDYESYNEDPELDKKKQMPCTTFTLTRILQFNTKPL